MATTTTTSSPIGPTVTPSPTSSPAPAPTPTRRTDDYDWLITPFTLVNESGTNSFMLTSADEPEPVPITLVGYAEFRVINPNVQIDIRIMGVTVWDANDEEQDLTGNFNIITENSVKDFNKVSVPINIVPKDVASYNTIKDKKLRLQVNFAYNYNMQSIVGTPVNYYFYPNDILANYNVYIDIYKEQHGEQHGLIVKEPKKVPQQVSYTYNADQHITGTIDYIPDNDETNDDPDDSIYEFVKTEISIIGAEYIGENVTIDTELNRFVDIIYTENRSESNSNQIISCDYDIILKSEYMHLFHEYVEPRIVYTTYFKIKGDASENIYSNVLYQAFGYNIPNIVPEYNTEPSQLSYKIYENFDNIIFSPDSLSFYVYEANNTEIDLNKLSIDVTYKNDHIADKFNIKYDKISNTSTDDFPVDTSQKIYNRVKVTLTPLYNVYDFNGTYQITAAVLTSSGGSTGLQFRTRSNTVSAQIYGTITYEFNISKEYDGSDVIMDNFATIYALYSLSPKFQFDSYAINLHVYNDESSPIRVDSYISSLNDVIYDTPNNTSEPPTGEPTTEDPTTDEPPTGEPTTETSTNDDITVSHVLSYITTYDTNGFITQVKINTDVLKKLVLPNDIDPNILLNCNFDITFQLFVKHIEDQTIVSVPSTNTLRYVYTNASMTISGKSSHNISSGKPYILSYNYILPSIYRLKPPIKIEIVHNNQSISKSYTYNLDEINNYASILFDTDVTPGYYDIYLLITYTDTNQRDITVSSDPKSVFLSKDLKDKPLARDAAYIYCYVPDGSGYKSSYPSSVNIFEEFINRYGVNIDQTYFEIYTNTNTPIFQYSYKTVGILKQLMLTFTNEGCTKIVSENPNDPTTCYVVYCISVTRNSHMFSTIYLNNFFKDVLHTDVFESTSQKVINTNGISMIEYENVDDNKIKKIDYYLVIPNGVLKQLPPITDTNGIFMLEDYINCTYYIKNSVLYVDIRYSNKYEDAYKNISYTALENQI